MPKRAPASPTATRKKQHIDLTLKAASPALGTASDESTHFHELVHVVQWARLGVDNFLLAYGVGLLQFGYQESPLERMAYSLQHDFERGAPAQDLVLIIEAETDAVWSQVAPLVFGG